MSKPTTWSAKCYPIASHLARQFERDRIRDKFVVVECEFRADGPYLGHLQRGRFMRQASEAVDRKFGELCPLGGFTLTEPSPRQTTSHAETLAAALGIIEADSRAMQQALAKP